MAKRNSSGGGGSTMYGVLAGLLIGLMVAAAVAYYVVKAPSPFVDKASRQPEATTKPDPRNAPDPNAALGAKEPSPIPSTAINEAPLTVPGEKNAAAPAGKKPAATQDDLGALIATLTPTPPTEPPARVEKPKAEPRKEPAASSSTSSTNQQSTSGTYYLQVGSFKVLEDAEALRARLIMMGMQVEIQRAEVNGIQFNRVRVGPYSKIDDMNKIRARLGEEKIPTTVVRQ
jgi:cell division protein FtsN